MTPNESKQLAYAEKLANTEPEETQELDPDEPSEAEMDRADERAAYRFSGRGEE